MVPGCRSRSRIPSITSTRVPCELCATHNCRPPARPQTLPSWCGPVRASLSRWLASVVPHWPSSLLRHCASLSCVSRSIMCAPTRDFQLCRVAVSVSAVTTHTCQCPVICVSSLIRWTVLSVVSARAVVRVRCASSTMPYVCRDQRLVRRASLKRGTRVCLLPQRGSQRLWLPRHLLANLKDSTNLARPCPWTPMRAHA